jgi:tRNA A37 methylthiotransferase MiaB
MNIADQLERLQQLRESGAINDEEFDQAKALVLNGPLPEQHQPDEALQIMAAQQHQRLLYLQLLSQVQKGNVEASAHLAATSIKASRNAAEAISRAFDSFSICPGCRCNCRYCRCY